MIQINCTNCKSLLQIDDAFAGGVCRCRHCGTIQTVPRRLRASSGNGDAGGAAESEGNGKGSSKTVFQQKKTTVIESTGSGTGLDDLAGIVASSGLTSSRLQKKPAAAAPPAPARTGVGLQDRRIVIIVSSAAGVIALLLGIIIFMAVRDRAGNAANPQAMGTPNAVDGTGGPGGGASAQGVVPSDAGKNPTFLGQPIPEYTISFVIDRGSGSGDKGRLEPVKAALVKSLKSLGPDRKFQIVLWGIGNDPPVVWPGEGMQTATAANITEVEKQLDQIYPSGITQEGAALAKAYAVRPQAVVLVPMKTFPGDTAAFAKAVLRKRADANATAKFYCFSIENSQWAAGLQQIASVTRGAYKDVAVQDVRSFGE